MKSEIIVSTKNSKQMSFWNFFKNNTLGLFQNEIRTIDDWIGWIKIGQPNAQTRKLNRSKNYPGRTFIGCWMQRWYQGKIRGGAQKPQIWQITGLHRLLFMRSIRVPSIIITQRTFLSHSTLKVSIGEGERFGVGFLWISGNTNSICRIGHDYHIPFLQLWKCNCGQVFRILSRRRCQINI